MMKLHLIASMLFAVVAVESVSGQSDFFFTFEIDGPNIDQTRSFNVGDTGSIYIYWSTNGPADADLDVAAFIDVFSSTSGVIEFTAASTFDYEIMTQKGEYYAQRLQGFPFCTGGSHGPPKSLSADFIDELHAFNNSCGPGIIEANNGSGEFIDTGYFVENDGFQWGRIDFNVIGEGTTTVTGVAGDPGIINSNGMIDATFSTATINAGLIVPEPTSVGLVAVAMVLVACVRRRQNWSL